MKTHIITHAQGTDAWHKHRAQHLNASDAAAVLGLSSYKTRSQLLHEKATGLTKEIDAGTQHRFAKGHEFEAIARPWAEEIVCGELYPVVLAGEYEGLKLSASLDGVDMASEFTFEHKTGRADLLASLDRGVIPDEYHPQMEMGLLLSGASKCLFMASSGDKEAMRFSWYVPNLELRAQIVAAWHQFSKDLAAYAPPEVIAPAVAAPTLNLPAVSIQVNGQIALVDNLDKFGTALTAYIEGLNRTPETDQDFANLEDAVKRLKAAEDALDAAESGALAQTDSIDTMRRTVALHRETARTTRLVIDKLVKAEKENRRTKIISDAVAALHTHMKSLQERTRNLMPPVVNQFQEVVKGLKSIDSMRDKVSTELARCKIAANATADRIQANLETKGLHGNAFLFSDIATLCLKAPDDFANTVTARITAHEAAVAKKEADTRERIRAEEQAKLIAEQEASAKAERDRIASEAAKVERIVTTTDVAPVVPPVSFADVAAIMPPAVRQAMAQKPAEEQTTEPTLKLGVICERLNQGSTGFTVTADFLASIGFEYAKVDRGSKLYFESDFPAICQALIDHIAEVQEQFESVAV